MMSIFEFMHRLLPWTSLVTPTRVDALTSGLLLLMTILCLLYTWQVRQRASVHQRSLQRFYATQALLLLGLSMDKQWGVLAWLTNYSRFWAMREGWYYSRRPLQFDLIVGIIGAGLLLFGLACWYFRAILRQHWLPLLGAIGLLTYVAVRAVSLHAVDAMLADRVLGVRLDLLLELGGGIFLFCMLNLAFYWQQRG